MDDTRIWGSEEQLWTGDAENYRKTVDPECLMVLPEPPYVKNGKEAVEAVVDTPRWTSIDLSQRQVSRPQEGLIVIAYHAKAEHDGKSPYEAFCTTTYRMIEHGTWRVVQHQQSPKLLASA